MDTDRNPNSSLLICVYLVHLRFNSPVFMPKLPILNGGGGHKHVLVFRMCRQFEDLLQIVHHPFSHPGSQPVAAEMQARKDHRLREQIQRKDHPHPGQGEVCVADQKP